MGKDASASAVYGSRAAFGVVLITTKKGKQNQPIQIQYSNNFSIAVPIYVPSMEDSYTYAIAFNQARANAGLGPKYYDVADLFQEILVPREIELKITEHYCEAKNFDETLYFIDMFKPFPDIYWALWSLIQMTVSKIDFDFYKYGKL